MGKPNPIVWDCGSKGCDPSEWPVDLCVREFPA